MLNTPLLNFPLFSRETFIEKAHSVRSGHPADIVGFYLFLKKIDVADNVGGQWQLRGIFIDFTPFIF